MSHKKTLVPIAKIGAPHGVKGFVRVFSLLDPDQDLSVYFEKPVLMGHSENSGVVVNISEYRDTHKHWLVRLESYSDRDRVLGLVHQHIYVPSTDLPTLPETQWYWQDLIGLSVFDAKNLNQSIGVVTQLFETGCHDVLEFVSDRDPNTKYLIPFVLNTSILSVDLESRQIILDSEMADTV